MRLEFLVETRVSLAESGAVEPHRDAGGNHHFMGGPVVRTIAQGDDFGFGCVHQFAKYFGLGGKGGVIVNELKDFGRVHIL